MVGSAGPEQVCTTPTMNQLAELRLRECKAIEQPPGEPPALRPASLPSEITAAGTLRRSILLAPFSIAGPTLLPAAARLSAAVIARSADRRGWRDS